MEAEVKLEKVGEAERRFQWQKVEQDFYKSLTCGILTRRKMLAGIAVERVDQ